jgi:hypothetical protein
MTPVVSEDRFATAFSVKQREMGDRVNAAWLWCEQRPALVASGPHPMVVHYVLAIRGREPDVRAGDLEARALEAFGRWCARRAERVSGAGVL